MKILIDNGGYEFKNHGDSAMLVVASSYVLQRYPNAVLLIFTNAPDQLKKDIPQAIPISLKGRSQWEMTWNLMGGLHKLLPKRLHSWLKLQEDLFKYKFPNLSSRWIESRLNRKGLDTSPMRAYLKLVEDADMVIASGGGFITDPFESHACSLLQTLFLAQNYGKPTAIFGQGLGPVTSERLFYWAKKVLPSLNCLNLREGVYSASFAISAGVELNKINVTGDDAIGLAYSNTPESLGNGIGINLRVSNYSGLEKDSLSDIREILNNSSANFKTDLIPVPISVHDGDSDLKALNLLLDEKVTKELLLDTSQKVIEQVASCRIVITGSYHAGVFALSQGISVIAVVASDYYRHKFEGLASQFGTGCKIVDREVPEFNEELKQAILTSWSEAENVRPMLLQKAREQIALSESAYSLFLDMSDR